MRTLSQVRTTFDGTHGKGTADLFLGLEADIFRASPRVLLRYAFEAIEVLLSADFRLPDKALKSTVLTPKEYAEQIRPAADDLRSTLVEVEDQKRETEEAQKVRTAALTKCSRTIIYGSRLLEALYILAGEEFHAKRLRPNVGTRIASVEDDEPGDGEPGDGEPGDGEPGDGEATVDEPASLGEESSDFST